MINDTFLATCLVDRLKSQHVSVFNVEFSFVTFSEETVKSESSSMSDSTSHDNGKRYQTIKDSEIHWLVYDKLHN